MIEVTIPGSAVCERQRILRLLRARGPALAARGIRRLCLFGSMARGEAGPGSDVDLTAELDPAADSSLLDHVGLKLELGELLGRRVEISTAPERMRPRIRAAAERDAIEVF